VDNPKHQAAIKWNVPCVRHEWLLACFTEREKVDVDPFLLEKERSTESRGSILMATPKHQQQTQNQGQSIAARNANFLPATSKQPEKFKVPDVVATEFKTPPPKFRRTTAEDTLTPLALPRRRIG
jgi:hypothetical protein